METLSSNTLFHFTGNASYLVSILQEGFKPRYCLENFSMFEFILGTENTELAVPMVCFCDIPLSKVKDHVVKYGSFGIGMTKDWGIREKVSPLMYVNEKSATTLGLSNTISHLYTQQEVLRAFGAQLVGSELFYKFSESDTEEESLDLTTLTNEQLEQHAKFLKIRAIGDSLGEAYSSQLRVIRFTKPYYAEKWRKWNNVRFYDEREWRFVPDIQRQKDGLLPWINKERYDDEIGRELFNYRLGQQFPLRFKPEDIKYIIVEKESQVPAIIRQIDNSDKYNREAIKAMLKSKILTKQQIFDDF
ncbi:MAG: hypothetical protein H7246_12075 [Phycisphaerae bacterium]|nr:hypothetical protein [Saprospiraceae bacterium]